MPLYQRLPKRGFNKPNRKSYAVVNLGLIQKFIDAKKLKAGAIDEDALIEAGVVRRKLDGVRVLAKGEITSKISLTSEPPATLMHWEIGLFATRGALRSNGFRAQPSR